MEKNNLEVELAVKKAVADFLYEMMDQCSKAADQDVQGTSSKKQLLVLMTDIIGSHDKLLLYIKEQYEEYHISLGTVRRIENGASSTFKEIFDLKEDSHREKLGQEIDNFHAICLLQPSIKFMEALIDTDDSEFSSRLFLYSLFHGRKTEILMDYDLRNQNSAILSKKMKKIADSLEDMGVGLKFIESGSKSRKGGFVLKNELVVQETIDNLWRKGRKEIEIGSGCIITPLARDRAKELGFKLIEIQ